MMQVKFVYIGYYHCAIAITHILLLVRFTELFCENVNAMYLVILI